jgi:hypothetical protein
MQMTEEEKKAYNAQYRIKNKEKIKNRNHGYRRLPSGRYNRIKAKAKARGIEFVPTFQEYSEIIKNPCKYCGGLLPEVGGGLDRIDSSKGYILGNVVPCCQNCNMAKGALSVQDFFSHTEAIYNYSIKKLD